MNPSDVCILIPARGGSKGLPGKNLRELGGKPLLAWTRDAVAAAGLENATCILTTDDPQIAAVGREIGLDVPFERPANLANDTAGAVGVAGHALRWLAEHRSLTPKAVMWLQPTSPFRPPGALAAALEMLEDDGVTAVVGVKPIHRTLSTLFWADEDMMLDPISAGDGETRRQAVRTMYTPNGALYLVRADVLRDGRSFMPPGTVGLPMNQIESLDLDDAVDFELMDAIARR